MSFMKIVLTSILTTFMAGCANQAQSPDDTANRQTIETFNKTTEWTYPYVAPKEKTEKILSGMVSIDKKMSYADVVSILGEPDVINDLRQQCFGLSPVEDGFLMRYRSAISYRVLYYLSKDGKLENLNDKWLSVYLASDGKTILTTLRNNIDAQELTDK